VTLYSKADLRNRALREIGVLDHGEEPDAEMAELVDGVLQQLLEYLNDEVLLIFDPSTSVSDQVIPGRIMSGLAEALKWEIGPSYSRPRETTKQESLRTLRRSIAPSEAPIPVQADYF